MEIKKVEFKDLTLEQIAEFRTRVLKDEQERKEKQKTERECYKQISNDAVIVVFDRLLAVSKELEKVKKEVYESLDAALQLKKEVYNTKEEQQTHSFSTLDGKKTIKIGYRVNEGWDDTLNSGIEKIREFLNTLAKDEDSANMLEMVMSLLRRDQKGNLKASRLLELKQLNKKYNNEKFAEGLSILDAAYRPQRTCTFVEAIYKDENGKQQNLPLSISTVN